MFAPDIIQRDLQTWEVVRDSLPAGFEAELPWPPVISSKTASD